MTERHGTTLGLTIARGGLAKVTVRGLLLATVLGASSVAPAQHVVPPVVNPPAPQVQDDQQEPQPIQPTPVEIQLLQQLQLELQQQQLQDQPPKALTQQEQILLKQRIDQQAQVQQQLWIGQQQTIQLPVTMPTAEQLRQVQIDPQLKAYLRQLDDPSFAVRQQANKKLVEATNDKLQLYAMLCRGAELTVEQRYRLLGVLRDQLVGTPRGALGISSRAMPVQWQAQAVGGPMQIGPVDANMIRGVRVDDLIPGMPAERVLRVGDRITHVDGQALDQMGELTIYVQTRKPGDKIKLTVQRAKVDDDGKVVAGPNNEVTHDTIQVDMALGSAAMLSKINPDNNQTSAVEINRLSEAREAVTMYSPSAVEVAVRGGVKALLMASAKPFGQPGTQVREFDPEVERFPAIRELQRDRQRIAQGMLPLTQALRQQWNVKFFEIAQNAQKPGMSSERQSFMQSVLQRYQELMNQ